MKILNTSREKESPTPSGASTGDIVSKVRSQSRIPKRWAWHCKTLLHLRDRILNDRREQFSDVATELEPHSMSAADSATDEFDHDLVLGELSLRQNALFEIDEALHRILNGTYGRCEESGAPIDQARLRAIPWTHFCKEVEERLEQKELIHRPSLGLLQSLRRQNDDSKRTERTRRDIKTS